MLYLVRRRKGRRKRRHYVRPAHLNRIETSFEIFDRYRLSQDPRDLEGFCRFTPARFDDLFNIIRPSLPVHPRTHLRLITGPQRLVVFMR